ncbi:MAG TPA: LysM peptidoglycan-binding domain-containing protein [Candidatus Saccharimonadales bacterium]|nr:LysM peptidoglycan-binding domain-containing protein [Candidatus Saccharimonadales bacterium]
MYYCKDITPIKYINGGVCINTFSKTRASFRQAKSEQKGETTKLPEVSLTTSESTPLRRKPLRAGAIALNVAIIASIGFFLINSPKTNGLSLGSLANSTSSQTSNEVNPVDQVSASDIALTVAQMNDLPEATAVANQAQTAAADAVASASTDNVVEKPQVVATALKSKADIVDYTTVSGDSVSSLATKFGITSNSIMWSNGLTSDSLTAGTHLVIPPVNGIVYTVKSGDTPASLASKYNADQNKIIAYNDAEIGGLTPGERIIIPDATLNTSHPVAVAAVASTSQSAGSGAFPWGNGPIYGSNGYDYGYCTWYVATQIPVPSNWGNASSWAYYASMSGWNVSLAPTVGSIAQTANAAGGEGHVAIVDAVSPDGAQIQIRDMNGIAGWGRVGYSGWIPASTFQHFITP